MKIEDRIKEHNEYLQDADKKHKRLVENCGAFSGCNLSDQNLSLANFSYADLSGAIFMNCDLSHTRFDNANLEGASFYKCKLDNARFVRTNLNGANFTLASISGSVFVGIKRNAKTVFHVSACGNVTGINIVGISGAGSEDRFTVYDIDMDKVYCGCWSGTLSEFSNRIVNVYGHLGYRRHEEWCQEYMFVYDYFVMQRKHCLKDVVDNVIRGAETLDQMKADLLDTFDWLEKQFNHICVEGTGYIVVGDDGDVNYKHWHDGNLTGYKPFTFDGIGKEMLDGENYQDLVNILTEWENKHAKMLLNGKFGTARISGEVV